MLDIKDKYLSGFKFIDLFAGIGGFHYALESYGAECVYASEWDEYAKDTYEKNFGIRPDGDITKVLEKDIPQHDILCGGFPCQAFSISGKQKGFEDTRGTLFFDIVRIIRHHKPKVVFLENVKNLITHDSGKTFNVILNTLSELGYNTYYKVLNTSDFGLPQNRERVYIVAFDTNLKIKEFEFPQPVGERVCLQSVLEVNPIAKIIVRDDIVYTKQYQEEFETTLFGQQLLLPNRPIQIGKVGKGGQGERIYNTLGHAITLSAYGGGVGSKTGLYKVGDVVRKLSTRECARCQGFPDSFIINPKEQQAYKQFGNSVSINVLQKIVGQIVKSLKSITMNEKQMWGSQVAKNGFKNEKQVAEKFNCWESDADAQQWLEIMGYDLSKIEKVYATTKVPKKSKTDVQIQVTVYYKDAIDAQNLQVKLVSNDKNGFNQVDRRWVSACVEQWGMPNDVAEILKYFSGEYSPKIANPKDERRMFMNEFAQEEQQLVLNWLEENKMMIVSDILKGRGEFAAEWILVAKNSEQETAYIFRPMNYYMNKMGNGPVEITHKGSIKINKITLQRKGGDNGRPSANQIQFKVNPLLLFDEE